MSTFDASTKQARYVELDSLRGLAALTVVLHHLRILWEDDTQPTSAILRSIHVFVAPIGTEAVILFFVLSGFVLSLPAVNGRPQTYTTFLIRRVFRIYVPYLAALAASVAGAFWLHGIITRSAWFHWSWSEPVSWGLVVQHLLFLGIYNDLQFDNPIWSLVHEMRISLIFPFLCAFVLRWKTRWSFLIAFGLSVSAIVLGKSIFHIPQSITGSLHYAGIFVLGIVLAREKTGLEAWFRRRHRITKAMIGIALLGLYLLAAPRLIAAQNYRFGHSVTLATQWIVAFASGGLMIVSMSSPWCKHILSRPPIHILGEISYSLYLWHCVVILYCVHLLYGKMPLLPILCLAFVLSILVSWCSYRWIEVPSMNLGRKLSNLPKRSFAKARA